MATLAGNTIASTYPLLLKIDSSGIDGTLRAVQDGDATDSALSIATDSVLVKGDGVKLFFYDADGGEHISANTGGVLSIAGASEIDLTATAIDINGTVDMSSTVQVGGALTVGADDAGHDVIFYGNRADSNVTWDTSEDDLILNDSRLKILQDEAERSLEIVQTGNGDAILIQQIGSGDAISINFDGTSGNAIEIQAPTSTTGTCLLVQNANALQTGSVAEFHSNSPHTGTRNVVQIQNDNVNAVNATALNVVQDAAAHAMKITQNANDYALEIAGAGNTSTPVFEASGNALTTGSAGYFYSAADRTADFPLVEIQDDNAADGGYGLKVRVDGNGDLIRGMAQGNNTKFVVSNTGAVGIGETAPSTQLVLKDGQSDAISDLDTGGIGLRWNGADGTFYGLVAMDSGSRTYNGGFMGFKGHDSGSAGERSIVFATKNGTGDAAVVERLMIHSGGEVTVHADNGGNGSLRITATSNNDTRLILQNQGTLKWNIRSKGNESHRIEIRDADENDGVIMAQGATAFSSGSDERLKCNWTSFNNALSDINSLTKVGTFQYKNFGEDKPRNDKVHSGLSAQEVQKFLPSAVDADKEGEKFLYLRYQELIPVLVKSIQELSAKVEALENA